MSDLYYELASSGKSHGSTNKAHTARAATELVNIIDYIEGLEDGDELNYTRMELELGQSKREIMNKLRIIYNSKEAPLLLKRTRAGWIRYVVDKSSKPGYCLGKCGKYLSYTGYCSLECKLRADRINKAEEAMKSE